MKEENGFTVRVLQTYLGLEGRLRNFGLAREISGILKTSSDDWSDEESLALISLLFVGGNPSSLGREIKAELAERGIPDRS